MLAGALVLLATVLTSIQDHQCHDQMNPHDMNVCARIAFAVERELDRANDTRQLSEAKLHEAPRGWLAFRDANCTIEGYDEARGGNMAPMIYEGCRAQLTLERPRRLRELAG